MPFTSIPLGPPEFWGMVSIFGVYVFLVAVVFFVAWIIDKLKRLFCLLILAFLLFPVVGLTHPGRLNSEGCHNVHKDWEYKDGRVVKAGTYHCHRPLGKMRLDGKEALQDPNDPGKEKEKSWLEWLKWWTN